MRRTEVEVLVVGAGPVGLTASLLLARRGIRNHVVDRRDGPHRAPQAHVINPRSLEICRMAGIDIEVLRAAATAREDGSHVRFVTTLAGDELGCLAYERQGDENLAYTPTPLLNLPQHVFEPILLQSVRAEALCTVSYGRQWTALEQDASGVTSRVESLADGSSQELHSRYLLAADGAGSRVRRSLGIEMDGPDRIQSFVMVHFQANLRELVAARPAMIYWVLDPTAAGSFVAHDIDRTWVFMHAYDPRTESRDAYDERRCAEIVRRALGTGAVAFEIRDISTWTMTAQVARRYRDGRVFLIGDSGHRFPPTGGMGMNTGIQDAHNLVWKLAEVQSGRAPATLLDSYETERIPVARDNADRSLANATKMFDLFEALGVDGDAEASRTRMAARLAAPDDRARAAAAIADQREHFDMFGLQLGFQYEAGAVVPDGTPGPPPSRSVSEFVPTTRPGARVPHAWVVHDGRTVSLLDLLPYDAFTLVTGRDGALWRAALERVMAARPGAPPIRCLTPGVELEDPYGHWAGVSEIEDDGALLVRPDQHVAWRSRSAVDEAEVRLGAALERALGGGA